MKATMLHNYRAPWETGNFEEDYPLREMIRSQLTPDENTVFSELRHIRIVRFVTERATDSVDPLKMMILARKPSLPARRRRAAMMGCEDWFRRADGKLAGQMLLPL